MPAVTRDLKIVYGSLTTGADSEYLIDGPWNVDANYETAIVSWRVVVQSDTESGFDTACSTLESEMRNINGALTITYGTTDFISYSHATNTGFLARPSFRVVDDAQTSRSRIYELSVSVNLPADENGKNGLRNASVSVSQAASGRRTLNVTGAYTAQGNDSATTEYNNDIATLITGFQSGLGGTWERTESTFDRDDEDKLLTFRDTSQEIIFNQASGGLNNAAIKNHSLVVSASQYAPGDSSRSAARRIRLTASWGCDVDKSQTTDLPGLWSGTILPHMISTMDAASDGSISIVRVDPQYDYAANRISGSVVGYASTASTLQYSETVRWSDRPGASVVPVWSDQNAYEKVVFNGPGSYSTNVTRRSTRLVGSSGGGGGGGGGGGFITAGTTGGGIGVGVSYGGGGGGNFISAGTTGGGIGATLSYGGGGSGGGGGGGSSLSCWSPGAYDILVASDSSCQRLVVGIPGYQQTIEISTESEVYVYAVPPTSTGIATGGGSTGGGGSGGTSTIVFEGP